MTGSRGRPGNAGPQVGTATPAEAAESSEAGTLRLSKRVAELGVCSRREADEFIERGWVTVDGVVVSRLGSRISPQQQVVLTSQVATASSGRETFLLHQPAGHAPYRAGEGRASVIALLSSRTRFAGDDMRVLFAQSMLRGLVATQLDPGSSGLQVLTQDRGIARRLTGKDSDIEHEYLVKVEGTLDLAVLSNPNARPATRGARTNGKAPARSKVSWQSEQQLRFATREGNPLEVRQRCESAGLVVTGLRRVRIGRIALGRLPEGQWRLLGEHERF